MHVAAVVRIKVKILRAFAQLVRQNIFGNSHSPLGTRAHVLQITVAAEIQSEATRVLFTVEVAVRARAQIEERCLPAIEPVVDRVDVLGEQTLQSRGGKFRERGKTVFSVGEILSYVALRPAREAIELHKREQRSIRGLVRQNAIRRCAEYFPMRQVWLRRDVHELAAAHQFWRGDLGHRKQIENTLRPFVQERVAQHQIEKRMRRRHARAEVFRFKLLRVFSVTEQPVDIVAARCFFKRLDCALFRKRQTVDQILAIKPRLIMTPD